MQTGTSDFNRAFTTLGVASIVLTYISSAKSTYIVGFQVQKIIETLHPYRIVIFIGQGLFVIMGLVSSSLDEKFPAMICLIGALICFIYGIVMAINFVFSERKLYNRVKKYIVINLYQDQKALRKASKLFSESHQPYFLFDKLKQNRMICHSAEHVAQFLSSQFSSRELTPHSIHSIDCSFLAEVLSSTQPFAGRTAALPLAPPSPIIRKPSDFTAFNSDVYWENAVLFRLPVVQDDMKVIIQCVIDNIEIWNSFLSDIEDIENQAAFARHLLYKVSAIDSAVSSSNNDKLSQSRANCIVLECGLLGYLLHSSSRVRMHGKFDIGRFLSALSYGRELPPLSANEKTTAIERYCAVMCGDISMILLCFTLLRQNLSMPQPIDAGNIKIKTVISICKDYCVAETASFDAYLAYAYILLCSIDSELNIIAPRTPMVLAVPEIKARLAVIFSSQEDT